jgi:hypothetical protein
VAFLHSCGFQNAEEIIKRFVRGENIRLLQGIRISAALKVNREDCDVVLLALTSRMA